MPIIITQIKKNFQISIFLDQDFCKGSIHPLGQKAGPTLGHARTANGQDPVTVGGQGAGREIGTERLEAKR